MAEIPKIGDTLRGKYRLAGVLGEGGMAVVFRATTPAVPSGVAVKVLRPEMLAMPDLAARFERETRTASRLTGPHAVRVIDVDTTESGLPFMVMDLLEGNDLAEELDLRGPLPPDEAVDYVRQACSAMTEAHDLGVVHRDLKPSNLYLCDDGGTRTVKVLDFGISKVVGKAAEEDIRTTHADTSVGTPMYMSPEQLRSSTDVDGRTDVWSLGVILYELLVGRPPFTGSTTTATAMILAQEPDPASSLRAEVPRELDAVLARALSKKAGERYEDTAAFAAALLPFAPRVPIGGERLARIAEEARANRDARLAPSTTSSPTLIRPKRAVVAAIAAASSKPVEAGGVASNAAHPCEPAREPRGPVFWLLVGLVAGLPFAAAIAYFALR
jgi:eukaryotic-like serine/threonine-protein kinase